MARTRLVIRLATVLGLAAGGSRAQGLQPRLQSIKDISVGVGEQIPNGFVGAGARAMGMGGVQVAGAMDGTALYWNPAALARVRRVEILGGLAYAQPHASADVGIQAVGGLTHENHNIPRTYTECPGKAPSYHDTLRILFIEPTSLQHMVMDLGDVRFC